MRTDILSGEANMLKMLLSPSESGFALKENHLFPYKHFLLLEPDVEEIKQDVTNVDSFA